MKVMSWEGLEVVYGKCICTNFSIIFASKTQLGTTVKGSIVLQYYLVEMYRDYHISLYSGGGFQVSCFCGGSHFTTGNHEIDRAVRLWIKNRVQQFIKDKGDTIPTS